MRTFKPDFPEMRMLSAKIEEYEEEQARLTDALIKGLRNRHAEALVKESQLEAKIAELEADLSAYADKNIQYTILKREVDSQRSQHDSLVAKLNELGVGAELKSPNATVLEYALEPTTPVTPRLSRNLIVTMLLAAILAGFTVFALERLNNAFRTPGEVEGQMKLPVLGTLPFCSEAVIAADLADNKSVLSEAYRSLRTSLQFAEAVGMPRVLLVTSAEPGEGKSTTAQRIASDFAALGQQVLLVDADMRRPSIHRRLKLPNRVGLSDLLARRVTRKAFPRLLHQAGPNFSVLTAGPVPANPVDLLTSRRTTVLLDALQRRYDLVVIDAPPVSGLSDAPILSRLADATLMVVSARQVSRQSALIAVARLRAVGANLVGVAVTKFRRADNMAGYAYSYGQVAHRKAVRAPRPAPALPKNAVQWDYFGDAHVPKPGLVGLVLTVGGDLRAGLVGSFKRAGRAYR